jgi:hypothetical protein
MHRDAKDHDLDDDDDDDDDGYYYYDDSDWDYLCGRPPCYVSSKKAACILLGLCDPCSCSD